MRIHSVKLYEGPNIYSHYPVMKLVVDLEAAAGMSTGWLPEFTEGLLKLLPSLRSHHCSRGRPGGFVERLHEGTYLGHVLEHLILELQHRAGYRVRYGTTRSGPGAGQAEVAFEYGSYRPALYLAREAVRALNDLLSGKQPSFQRLEERLDLIRQRFEPGPSTAAIVAEARARDIPVLFLQEGSSLLLLGQGVHQKKIQATLTGGTGCLAADLAADKCLAKALLERAGIPTPRGEEVGGTAGAVDAARRLGVPVAVKPCNGNQGKGVSLNLSGSADIARAYYLAARYSGRVMVEEYIEGRHYRLLVVGGRLVAAARRLPAQVKGDGRRTVADLVESLNRDPRRGVGHARPLTRIRLDEAARVMLERQGLCPESVPAPGRNVLLRENANLSTGGCAWDVTFKVHPDNALLAERAAAVIGLEVAGIDLVAPDIAVPIRPGAGAVIEVNAAPGIRMHLHPSRGRSRNVARDIVSLLFPRESTGRIPVASVTGTNGKTTTVRLLAHLLGRDGRVVGATTTDGVIIGGRKVFKGDTTGPRSARMVLEDPAVEAAVLESARGGLLRDGLGYERCDVAVVTNISADHLGQDGLETIDDLVFVKSLVVEAVDPGGAVVLNAEDANVLKMVPRAAAPVIYFALREDNLVLLRHLAAGGRAVFVRDGTLCWFDGSTVHPLLPVADIALAWGGRALHHMQNAAAAAAAALALGVSIPETAGGLRDFKLSAEHNPGRGNFFSLTNCTVLLDYGHNPAALEATLQFASRLGHRRVIGVVGVPGDRNDALIRQCGRVCRDFLDEVVIKEDLDLRGRAPGETARLLRQGFLETGRPSSMAIHEILPEPEAVRFALDRACPGDLVVVFYEHRQPILDLIQARRVGGEGGEKVLEEEGRTLLVPAL